MGAPCDDLEHNGHQNEDDADGRRRRKRQKERSLDEHQRSKHAARVKTMSLTNRDLDLFMKCLKVIMFIRSHFKFPMFSNLHKLETFLPEMLNSAEVFLPIFLHPKTHAVQFNHRCKF